jgi:hypothetical protein
MKEIVCQLNMYSLGQPIYLVDTEQEQATVLIGETIVDELPAAIKLACEDYGVYKIHLMGIENYAEPIAKDVRIFYNQIKYSEERDIEIEVN